MPMNKTIQTPLPLLLALLLWGPPAPAADNNFALDPEPVRPRGLADGPVPTIEATVPLPPWPRDADLIAFVPDGPQTPLRYAIDGKNLKLGDARGTEVHYTLVIESASGTRNLSFEGIRCTLRGAYKTFAYGSDGRFTRAPAGEWQPLDRDSGAYREDLRLRFCVPREMHARPVKDLLRALRGRIAATEGTGFQAQ